MKLGKDQIKELYTFTRRHYVEHYDLQTELVDHLANGIEAQIKQRPELTFKEALDMEFKKFGVFGFHDVIKDKTKVMEKRYWKVFLRFYKEYFKLPKVMLLFGLSMVLYLILGTLQPHIAQFIPGSLMMVLLFLMFIKTFKKRRKSQQRQRKWLFEDLINAHGNVFGLMNLGVQVALFPDLVRAALATPIWGFSMSFIVTLICLLLYVIIYVIPLKTEELLAETYPEYKMVSACNRS